MNDRAYSFDAELRIWRTPAHDSLAYSDGDEVERYLLAALQKCRDLASTSDELRQYIIDWPSEYHFSPQRHALLRPFSISPGDRVLELGCGCGAITRYLGETGATVVAVEGSRMRAQITAERCRDLPNVSVYCDNLADFASADHYQLVTLIGVLEYAPAFIAHDEPVAECLLRVRSHLASDGRLLAAIENRLGLKYFAGCAEDHTGVPFLGIEGGYKTRTVLTFGRRELAGLLERTAFQAIEWYYPFPDYKLPRIVLSAAAITASDLDVATLLARVCSRDYRGDPLRGFDEVLARRSVWKNGLLGELANSFLILAAPNTLAGQAPAFLAEAFNLSRRPRFCTKTEFTRDTLGVIRVARSHLLPASKLIAPTDRFVHQLLDEHYVHGRLVSEELHALARHGWSVESLSAWAAPWLAEIRRHACSNDPSQLPPDFIDFTPFNAIKTGSGKIAYIDAEWRADSTIPLLWVFIRGLAYSFDNILQPAGETATRRTLITAIGARLGMRLSEADFTLAENWEAALQEHCCGGGHNQPLLTKMLDRGPGSYLPLLDRLSSVCSDLEKTINSRSWRITAPLRWGMDLLDRIKNTVCREPK